jgi:hypothetical protein
MSHEPWDIMINAINIGPKHYIDPGDNILELIWDTLHWEQNRAKEARLKAWVERMS